MICPICKEECNILPAISIKDHKTEICSECGIIETVRKCENDKQKAQEFIDFVLACKKVKYWD